MSRIIILSFTLLLLIFGISQAHADEENDGEPALFSESSGCMEGPLAQFGRYIGKWKIEDSSYQREDGSWKAGAGARWDFACLGNGTAIQDFWMPNDGGTGTNLRTWNKETGSWDIAWTMTGMSGFAHIGAKQADDGSIVMEYKSPIPVPPRRITFFEPEADRWDWKLEISPDEGETWVEVYRIKATRID